MKENQEDSSCVFGKGELAAFHTHCLLRTENVRNSQPLPDFTSRAYHQVEFQSNQKLRVTCDHRQSIYPSRPLTKLFVTIGMMIQKWVKFKIVPKCQALQIKISTILVLFRKQTCYFSPRHFGTILNFH